LSPVRGTVTPLAPGYKLTESIDAEKVAEADVARRNALYAQVLEDDERDNKHQPLNYNSFWLSAQEEWDTMAKKKKKGGASKLLGDDAPGAASTSSVNLAGSYSVDGGASVRFHPATF